MNNLWSKLLIDMIFCLYFPIVWCLQSTLALRTPRYYGQELPRTQTSLYWKKKKKQWARRGVKEPRLFFSSRGPSRFALVTSRSRFPLVKRNAWGGGWDRSLIPGRSYKEMYGNISRAITDTSRGPNAAFVIVLLSLQRTPWTYFFKNDIFCFLCGNVLSLLDLCTNYNLIFTIAQFTIF